MSMSDNFAAWCDGVEEALRAAGMVEACSASGDVTEAVQDAVSHAALSALVVEMHESESLARRLAYDLSECKRCSRPCGRCWPRRPSSLARAQVRAQRELGAVARMVDAHPGVTVAAMWLSTMAGLLLGAVLVRMGG